ncbi:type VI secretion system lipoprotein TssJ [Cupriavidus sp. NPDC089707]|uniref:type VI secretion system lipoprotein TssJ n=1 Tax=Cupriavidus sp. NPDC089707 TaxID=3363963 RepID=UPI003801809B
MRIGVVRGAAATLATAVLLGACSAPQPVAPKEQIKLELSIDARSTVNPDDKGRASPVLVRVYELKTETAFENADYFSLDKNDKTVLTQDQLARDEFVLRPGESRDIERKLNPDTTALGLLIGYRDLGKATWRTVYKLPPAPAVAWYRTVIPARKVKLQVSLDQQTITVSKPD